MQMGGLRNGLFVLLLVLSGCHSQVATTDRITPEDSAVHLSDKIDISLADWLQLPRVELAKRVEEWVQTVRKQQQWARSNVESVCLLPQLRPPLVTVGFAEARFWPTVGFSLPPYVPEGQKDAAVALHLARLGDEEAARKLADPADKNLLAEIDACLSGRNYPIEWTRLVSLVLQSAELKLANGEPEGATELVQLHRQLLALFAPAGGASAPAALRAALLPRGRQALTLAAAAWRENKAALAADIETALTHWGETPDPAVAEKIIRDFFQPKKTAGVFCNGQAAIAQTPLAVQRFLDLLTLPLPSEGADGVAVFLDDKQNLAEVLVVYRPKLNEWFPQPQQLAWPLVEHGYKSTGPVVSSGLIRQSWVSGHLSYEVTLLTRGSIGGAVIDVQPTRSVPQRHLWGHGEFVRDFGAIHLDRSFEQNRLLLAPNQTGASLEIKEAAQLAAIRLPAPLSPPEPTRLKGPTLAAAVLQREANEDLLAQLILRWPPEQNHNALSQLALPLWAAYGPARLESVEEASGGHFLLTWQNETTQVKLILPFEDKAPELLVEDSRGPTALKARVQAAAQLDQRERQERIAAGKPRQYLPRFLPLAWQGIDNLRLGQKREEVLALLTGIRSLRVRPLPESGRGETTRLTDGLNILVLEEKPATATFWPRQLFVRFDTEGCVSELRIRYQEEPQTPASKAPRLLDQLRTKSNGSPQTLPPTWAGLWADLPARSQPILYRWQDDVTCLTYQHDSGGSEVVLRDRSCCSSAPLLFCRRGVEGCVLGDTQAEVHKRWRIQNPLLASNRAEVLVMPANSPFDVLLVWYDNEQVSRLIARHRQPKPLKADEVSAALQHAWGADLDHLGFLRRYDGTLGRVLQSYGFHDDRTRVRLFAQETEEGIRLFTEWRDWPVAVQMRGPK